MFLLPDLRSVIFALVVDRKELDLVDESKQLLIQSLRPEPEAVMTAARVDKVQQPKRQQPNSTKKTRVRVVDLEGDVRGQEETAATPVLINSMAISIPENGSSRPSLLLHNLAGSPGVESLDSQSDAAQLSSGDSSNSKQSAALNLSDMRQMLLDLTEKKRKLEEAKASLQLQLHGSQLEKQELEDRLKSSEQQNTETTRYPTICKLSEWMR